MPSKISNVRPAGPGHQVFTVTSSQSDKSYRKIPCAGCPWLTCNDALFPAEAFKHSAGTAYDMAMHEFGCHDSGQDAPKTCAGFILKGSHHNLRSRLQRMQGRYSDVVPGKNALHDSYRSMALANGVSPTDPVLEKCRA